jgi:NAD-specific glutamate dehydrogenase
VDRCRAPFERLCGEFDGLLKTGERARLEERYRELRAAVGDGDLADELARLEFAGHLLNVLNLAFTRGVEVRDAGDAYFGLSEFVDFGTLETAARSIAGDDRWERRAARDLAGDVARARLALCAAVLGDSEHGIDAAMRTLRNRRAERLRELDQTIAEFRALSIPSLAALQVAVRVLGRLAHGP